VESTPRIDIYRKKRYAYIAFFFSIGVLSLTYKFLEIRSPYFLIVVIIAGFITYTSLKEMAATEALLEIDDRGIYYARGIYQDVGTIEWANIKKIEASKNSRILVFLKSNEELMKQLEHFPRVNIEKNLSLTGAEIVINAASMIYDKDKLVELLKSRVATNDNQKS